MPLKKARVSGLSVRSAYWLAILLPLFASAPVRAQNPDELLPADSAARAKVLLDQAVQALGGDAYLNAQNLDCSGQYAQFEHTGNLGGFSELRQLWHTPDENRVEYGTKHNIAEIYVDGHGWSLDRGGVSELPDKDVADYHEQLQTNVNMILRFRRNEDGVVLRYGGTDVVDLKQIDWVEVSDRAQHNVRIAIDRKSHLPVRSVVLTRDPDTGNRIQTETRFSNYQPIDGVQTPMQTVRLRNGTQVYQLFYESCRYNQNLPADYFARASLDNYFAQTHKKK
jgi:hypothetical protein